MNAPKRGAGRAQRLADLDQTRLAESLFQAVGPSVSEQARAHETEERIEQALLGLVRTHLLRHAGTYGLEQGFGEPRLFQVRQSLHPVRAALASAQPARFLAHRVLHADREPVAKRALGAVLEALEPRDRRAHRFLDEILLVGEFTQAFPQTRRDDRAYLR